ncbi:MAG: sigma-70 family RNA polymerase sigma factor [Bacilli bacterium]|nr:sigma-70 family RNA polymerase sigma factor [Bacilli bacterium]MDE6141158.1 sigma-70 family RNA polymerase sigma factor [Bacilli bacterium]
MDELISENELLIHSIARKFYNVEKEDLYQAGCLGLIKAYNNYQDTSVPFSSYAYKYIFGEMYELTIKSRNIKLNKDCLKIYKNINKARSYITQVLGREATLEDICAYLEIDVNEAEYVMRMAEDMFSLDDEMASIQIGVEGVNDDLILLSDSLDTLDPLSSAVIKYRYQCDMTQKEVADILGISQVNVSRIELKSKKKILEYISL